MPAIILKTSEFCKSVFPKKDAEAPKITNTLEKPKQNKIKEKTFIFLDSKIFCKDWPEMYEIYPGIKGNTQGDKKLTSPAANATKNSNIYPVFFIAADMPAIEVRRESFKYFLFFIDLFFLILLITIG